MTRPRVGIGIVSGGNRLAGTDGGREGTGPPAGKIRSRISSSLSRLSDASLLSFSPKSLITVFSVQHCIHNSLEIPVALIHPTLVKSLKTVGARHVRNRCSHIF